MSGPPHQFPTGFTNPQQNTMRSQFGQGPIPGQLGGGLQNPMGSQLGNQMPVQLGNQMVSPMSQLSQGMGSSMNAQMMGQMNQPYLNPNLQNTMQQQAQTQLQLQQQQLQQQLAQQQSTQQQMQQTTQQLQQQAQQQQTTQQLQQQAQQQQSTVQNTNTAPTPPAPQPVQSKEINTVSLCRIGQETVQDIVSRTQEVFQNLKAIQPPNGTVQGSNASNEKKVKVQEQLRTIRVLFKRLRLIYEKCNENCQLQGMEYTHIESLIPFKDDPDPKSDEKKTSEAYRVICEENKEIMEQVVLKNRQLKEVIDHLRRIIWEINTMLAMRRS